MKILVVCQRYWPEQFKVTDICEELAARGHEVTVLTGLPNVGVPGGIPGVVPGEYRRGGNREQERNGVRIVRSFEVGHRTGVAWRALNYHSFWKSAERKAAGLGPGFDVVFAYQLSPAMMAAPAVAYKRRFGVPVFLYCCDLWPESMKAMLGERGAAIIGHYGKVCRRIYSACDRIGVQSPAFEGYFRDAHGIPSGQITYFPQFAEDGGGGAVPLEPHEGVNVVFMGNMGAVQGIPTMVEAMAMVPEELGVTLHFVGDGSAEPEARALAGRLGLGGRVVFHGHRPASEMRRFYSLADVCVMCLDDSTAIGLTVPQKLSGYLSAGRPVAAAVAGGARAVIEESGAGIAVDPGDACGLAGVIAKLAGDPGLRERCAANAAAYAAEHLTKRAYVDRLEAELSALAAERKGRK